MEYLPCPKCHSDTVVYERGKALLSETLYSRILTQIDTEEQMEEGQGLEIEGSVRKTSTVIYGKLQGLCLR